MIEEWREVVGFEGLYEVSNHGNVKSVDREVPHGNTSGTRKIKGRILKQYRHNSMGHWIVGLCREGKSKNYFVHSLVLEAFVGPKPQGKVACHGEKGTYDNCLDNLRYGTQWENVGPDRNRDHKYTSDQTGVHWHKRNECWHVTCRKKYVGKFDNHEEAVVAAKEAYENVEH